MSQVFDISLEEASAAVQDIRLGDSYGFLTAAFKPEFFMSESLDMLREWVSVAAIIAGMRIMLTSAFA